MTLCNSNWFITKASSRPLVAPTLPPLRQLHVCMPLVITDDASPFALRSTRHRQRRGEERRGAVPAQPGRCRLAAGAAGERRTAHLLAALERHGWVVLHDLAVPGSRANFDHLVIGPGGVFVIDSKQYRGRLQLDPTGRLWHGCYPLAPILRAVSFEADQAAQVLTDPDVVVVVPIVAVHGAQVPWGKVVMDGVPVVSARRLPSMLRALPAVLGSERVAVLADQARVRFHAAA
jgi:Nuclease-related domain